MIRRITLVLACLLLAFTAAGAQPLSPGDVQRDILAFKAAQSGAKDAADWAATGLPAMMGQGGEWYALAMSQEGGVDLSGCRTALQEYLAGRKVRSATTRQKLALTLVALGGREEPFVASTLADSIGKQGVMSWAWGLHLFNNGCTSSDCTVQDVIDALLVLRKEDGGWAITGNVSDPDATCMVIQALAPYCDQAAVQTAVDGAVLLLSAQQHDTGGFSSYGLENAESAAQVIIALCAARIDPAADPRFSKPGGDVLEALLSFQLPDGSFSHEKGGAYSEIATAQAYLAMAAWQRFQAGEGSIYLLDGETVPGEVKTAWGYRTVAAVIIGGASLVCCVLLLVLGKRHPKNFLAVAAAAGLLTAAVYLTDIQSADSYYSAAGVKKDAVGSVTLSIDCSKVAGRAEHIPGNGVLLAPMQLPIAQGDTVYTVLTDAARLHGIHMESSGAKGLVYIHGLGNIYEFDFGDLSGWIYLVNGESASIGCDQHVLRDGDVVEFRYTLELGRDMN